jgi:predicted outer membrane repeat protein
VCGSGCAYSTIQPAVAAAASGATIRIDAGTYREDVTVDKSLTLKACNGATVTWYNLTDGQRALFVPRADPGYNVVVEGITFTSDSTSGGGIHQENGALTLSGSTTVTGCKAEYGGGVHFGDGDNGGVLVLQGSAIVTSNSSDSYGGGIYMDSYTTLEMRGTSAVTNNVASGLGGGVFTQSNSSMTMRDDASVTGNASTSVTGGGIEVYGGTGAFLVMHDRSSVSGNSCQGSNPQYDGGGGVNIGSPGYLTMDGDTIISGNASTASGGGVRTNGQVTMSGNAAIKQNTATGGSGGGIFGAADAALTKNAPATITGNSPDQCGGSLSC